MLTDTACKSAKPRDTAYKLADGEGLHLEVQPNGSRWWRLRYRFAGKEKMLSMGTYPQVTLKEARQRRTEARQLLTQGIDPSAQRKAVKAAQGESADSFEVIAREWFGKHAPTWQPSHSEKIIQRLERDVFPWLGSRPIAEIKAPELLAVLRRIENRGALDTAHRALQNVGQIMRYAVATGRAERNPAGDLKGALPPVKGGHFSAITEPQAIGALLRAIDDFQGTFPVKCALRLAPLVFVRPGELRQAQWSDIDLETSEWRYRVTKTSTDHIVPLSTQALAILKELHPLTGHGRYVFPSARTPNGSRPMSDMGLLAALRRMGFDKDAMSVHGFRALARTVLDEALGFPPHLIEHQLAHSVKDPLGRAYNRTAHLPERRKMMQAWADYLDTLKAGTTNVVPFKKQV